MCSGAAITVPADVLGVALFCGRTCAGTVMTRAGPLYIVMGSAHKGLKVFLS